MYDAIGVSDRAGKGRFSGATCTHNGYTEHVEPSMHVIFIKEIAMRANGLELPIEGGLFIKLSQTLVSVVCPRFPRHFFSFQCTLYKAGKKGGGLTTEGSRYIPSTPVIQP